MEGEKLFEDVAEMCLLSFLFYEDVCGYVFVEFVFCV